MSEFVQIIEYRTKHPDAVLRLQEQWARDAAGRGTALVSMTCVDRGDGHYATFVEFPSHQAAMENNALPETQQFANELARLCEGTLTFHDMECLRRLDLQAPDASRRMVADCRDLPSDNACSLTISGREDEVIEAAVAHAVAMHGHTDTLELREMIRGSLKEEQPTI